MTRRLGLLALGVVVVASLVASLAAGPTGAIEPTGAAVAGAAVGPVRARTASPSTCPTTPFTSAFDAALRARWPGQRFSVAVHDRRDGCRYDYRPDLRITTASVMKAEILAGLLLRAQAEGRGLTRWEHDRVVPMISRSDNPTATALWTSLGGTAGMRRVDAAFGLSQTAQGSPWGGTATSARDRTRLMRLLVTSDGGPLGPTYRTIARQYLLGVVPQQRWGITSGIPAGTTVPMKNGFASSQCCRWRLNSSGVVEVAGGGYVVTIMSDGWPNEGSGIQGVEWVSRQVAARLGGPFGVFRSPAAFVDQQYADFAGRAPTVDEVAAMAQRIGFTSSRGADAVAQLGFHPSSYAPVTALLRLYDGAYDRWPTGSMFAYRVWQLRRGAITSLGIAEEMARSAELVGTTPLTDAAFVDRVVRRVMGWAPSTADLEYWAGRLQRGEVSRGGVLLAYVGSAEHVSRTSGPIGIAAIYLAMLVRAPDPASAAYWAERLSAGTATLTNVVATVLGSPEYRARVT